MLQITSKTHVHRPSVLNSHFAGDSRLNRIVFIFGSSWTLNWNHCNPPIPHVADRGNTTRHWHVSKLRLLIMFPSILLFRVPAPLSGLPSLREVAWVHHFFALEQQRARVVGQTTQSHNERSTALFPDLSIVFQHTTNVMWKFICSHTCGPRSQRLALPNAVARNNSFGQGHCSVKPPPFHPNAEAVTVLAHSVTEIEGLTNTWQPTAHLNSVPAPVACANGGDTNTCNASPAK